MLADRQIVLGVTGGIAAYKAIELCRRFVDAGAHVAPVLTAGALRFVGATTFSALASEPVRTTLWSEDDPIPHTRLGQRADLILVAPATARFLAAYAAGYSHDLLTATVLATRAPVVVCPAMHTEMWEHPAVQANLATLRARGVVVVEPEVGRLAGGDVGTGRLAGPETILAAVERVLGPRDLAGRRVLVTAGGTREPIDPVRFIGNRSSGKQGHALAEAALRRGAEVTLITTSSIPSPEGIRRIPVSTAAEMADVVGAEAPRSDVVLMAAAVADFRPTQVAAHKLKKTDGVPVVTLEPTPDILAELGRTRRPGQVIVGFAAETTDVAAHAAEKLARKGADIIVANDVSAPGVGFEHDTNAVSMITASGRRIDVGLADKATIAAAVLDLVVEELAARPTVRTHNPTRERTT